MLNTPTVSEADVYLLKKELAETRYILEGFREVQASGQWVHWVQGIWIKANLILDVVAICYILWLRRQSRDKRVESRADTGGSSDSEDTTPETDDKPLGLIVARQSSLPKSKTRPTRPSDLRLSR